MRTVAESKDVARFVDMFNYHFENHPGLLNAYRSTAKHFPLQGLQNSFRAVGASHGYRIQCIWGTADQICPFPSELTQLMPNAHIVQKDNTGHSIGVEEPQFVYKTVEKFIS
jgi:pimeloyl-ACP methyl ester carboxylesterase